MKTGKCLTILHQILQKYAHVTIIQIGITVQNAPVRKTDFAFNKIRSFKYICRPKPKILGVLLPEPHETVVKPLVTVDGVTSMSTATKVLCQYRALQCKTYNDENK